MSSLHYWQYFVALESDLAHAARFVEIGDDNMNTYSIEFAQLILSAGSEVDVLAKVLCDKYQLTISPSNIDGYRKAIVSRFPKLPFLEVIIPRYNNRKILPWSAWEVGKNPDWWRAYNDIKHERNKNFKMATLGNVLQSIAGLFVLVCYICNEELRKKQAEPWPKLLTLDPKLSDFISSNLRPGYVLPDFE